MKSVLASALLPGRIEAGCDEAGRGCLAGPVVAAAVILPPDFEHPLLNDSKQLTERQRDLLRSVIEARAISWGVGFVSHTEIDQINILNASLLAMHRAIDKLLVAPEHLVIDGNRFKPFPGIGHTCVVKGDSKILSVAAASVLAKTHRDEAMMALHARFPGYGWDRNKGYPTREHRKAIEVIGTTPYHRTTFRLTDTQLKIGF